MNKKIRFEASGIREGLRTLGKGCWRVLCGAAVAAMIGAAGFCFYKVPSYSGYVAVAFFTAGATFLIEGLCQIWFMGGGKKQAGAFGK